MLLVPMVVHRNTKKGGAIAGSPLCKRLYRMLNLELISPVQIAVYPASTTPGTAVLINPEVSSVRSWSNCSRHTTASSHRCSSAAR